MAVRSDRILLRSTQSGEGSRRMCEIPDISPESF
jgi:hypothetical protein